jgi:hypothetical protein
MIVMMPLSSAISVVTYDEEKEGLMTVEFIDRPQLYQFSKVPYPVFEAFVLGGPYGSVGMYYHKHIKGKFPFEGEIDHHA